MRIIVILAFVGALALFFQSCAEVPKKNDPTTESEGQFDSLYVVEKTPLELLDDEIIKNPESPNVYYKRAEYYHKTNDYDKAIDDINRALKLTPDNGALNYAKAKILYDAALFKGDITYMDEAEIYLNHTLKVDSLNTDAMLLLAEYNLAKNESNIAMKLVNQALKISPTSAEPYFEKGMIYQVMGNPKLAESSFQTAIEMNANYYDAYVQLGMLNEEMDLKKAEEYYTLALTIHPEGLDALRNRGLLYLYKGEYTKAIEDFNTMLEIDSTFAECYFNIGNTYVAMYEDNAPQYTRDTIIDRSIEYFQKAVDIQPDYVPAMYNLALGYKMKGDKETAKALLKQVLSIEEYEPALKLINSL